jgi:hypothetical protein
MVGPIVVSIAAIAVRAVPGGRPSGDEKLEIGVFLRRLKKIGRPHRSRQTGIVFLNFPSRSPNRR